MFWLNSVRKAGMETVREGHFAPGMRDLPEFCIACVLSKTTPGDVGRLACVSRIFRDASNSDLVWHAMLPPYYEDILAQAPDAPASSCSKKEVYDYLTTPVLLENGTQDFWMDRATGGVCRSIGAKGLFIVWGNDRRYWGWAKRAGSRFPDVAQLRQVCWLEVDGTFQCCLTPGTYTLSWRLSFALETNECRGFNYQPVKFYLEGPDRVPVRFEEILISNGKISGEGQLPSLWTWGPDKTWGELDVGEFTVERGDLPVAVKFLMMQVEGGIWKTGFFMDGVTIRPTAVRAKEKLRQ